MVAGIPSAALFHDAFETLSVGMVMLDLEGRIQYANRAYSELLQYTAEDLFDRAVLSLRHPEDYSVGVRQLAALSSGESDSLRTETRLIAKGGAVLLVRISSSLLRGAEGRPKAVISIVEDVTRQYVIEQARRELYREREALLDSTVDGIYGVDLTGCCTFVNRSAAEMLGYTPDEMLGRNMHALVHATYPDGRPFPPQDCRIVQAFSHPENAEHRLHDYEQTLWRKDATPVLVEHSAEPVIVDGELRGSVVTLRDTSERNTRRAEREALLEQEQTLRKQAEQLNGALQRKEAALREALAEQLQLMEAIPQMVWVIGPSGEPEYVNQRWRAFTGVAPDADMLGWRQLIHPDDRSRTEERFNEALRSGEPYEVEHRMQSADGSYRWVLARARPLLDAAGKVSRWFGTSTDIHDRKMAEELLRRTEKLAAAGRLAASVAHEINNPLEAVGNLVYLLQHEAGLSPAAVRYLQMANDELSRVGHIVNQTLGFYRESSMPETIDLSTLVSDVLALYQRKLDARQIRVTRSLESGVTVRGVAGELRQVVANLVSNAMDAMEPYGVLAIEVRSQQQETRLSISDTGPGIAKPVLQRIFEPFFTTKKDGGTGLGLWVSQGIVEKHRGRFEVTSSQQDHDHGTAFVLTLPRSEDPVLKRA